MPPPESIRLRPAGQAMVPDWLGPEDHPWLEALLDELRRFEGRRTREWRARAMEPLRARTHEGRRRWAVATLHELCAALPRQDDVHPPELRARLFTAAQRAREEGEEIDALLAREAPISKESLLEALYLDLPSERPLLLPDPLPDPPDLARHTNLHIARRLIRSAAKVDIHLASRSRAIVRQIRLRRLLATVHPRGAGVHIQVSGPFALFRHTTLYGRSLASLLPVLRGVEGFELLAHCDLGAGPVEVRLASGDPFFPPGLAPKRFDSKLEARFAKDFACIAPDWDLVREPEPISVAGTWIFPDFALIHRRDGRRWLLEIVGFWTPAYLQEKLHRLRLAGRDDLIVAIDEKLGCGDQELAALPRVIRFRGRVDAKAVAQIVTDSLPARSRLSIERRILRPGDLFIDHAGRRPGSDPIHARLAALSPGVPVALRPDGAGLWVLDANGQPVAALSAAARARWSPLLPRVQQARVVDLVVRHRTDSHPAWRHLLQVERWRLPVVEVDLTTGAPP